MDISKRRLNATLWFAFFLMMREIDTKKEDAMRNIAIQKKLKWIFTLSADDSSTQTINMTTIFNCADCRKAIKENSREHDDCWTNMEKDDDLWYCGDCKDAHMDDEDDEEVVCPRCDRTEKECEEQAEDKDNKNPITDWCGEWGLSCDECYYKANPESDDDDVSINTQEECCECELTEKQYNEKKGYEENLSTLHYACGKTYCPDCREPCENSDDDDDRYVCGVCGKTEPKDVEWDVGASLDFDGNVICPACEAP